MVATYNVENLFSTMGHRRGKDASWQPHGAYHWTEARLANKIANVGRALAATNGGRGPDVVGLVEIEDESLLERLRAEGLAGLGYHTALHADWGHGLGTALLSRLPLASPPARHQPDPNVRGVLEVTLSAHGSPLSVLVNHWPSRGGGDASAAQRRAQGQLVRNIVRERLAADPARAVVVLGDFNAEPNEDAMREAGLLATADPEAARSGNALLYNAMAAVAAQAAGKRVTSLDEITALRGQMGTLLATHERPATGELTMFDQILVSPGLLGGSLLELIFGATQIVREGFLLDRAGKPRRTLVSRDRAEIDSGGTSDHLPVVTRLRRASP